MNFYCNESFPNTRLRRNRKNHAILDLTAEINLNINQLILPIFIIDGINQSQAIKNLPDIYRYSIDLAVKEIALAWNLGIKAIMLFPCIDNSLKNSHGTEALNPNNLICKAIKAIKKAVPNIQIIADVALDPYTNHGHDGIISNEVVNNDKTIEALCDQALVQAQAGCDILAPSDMMDGRVGAIRKFLDKNNLDNISIMSYSAKYVSSLYEPFREAVGSIQISKKPDKSNYQMDYRNSKEAMREIALDISEGADMIIIKPAINYLDIIHQASTNFPTPIYAYQVSGEYAMLKLFSSHNNIDFIKIYYESLISILRAGARGIITYGAIEIAKKLKE